MQCMFVCLCSTGSQPFIFLAHIFKLLSQVLLSTLYVRSQRSLSARLALFLTSEPKILFNNNKHKKPEP